MTQTSSNTAIRQGLSFLDKHQVFFGHQSVGENILAGLSTWIQELDSNLNLIHPFDSSPPSSTGIIETKIGQNTDPHSKLEDFQQKCLQFTSENLDVAIMKFCYIDFNSDTDLNSIKTHYIETFLTLENAMPGCQFIHMTVPYVSIRYGLRSRIKKLLGKPIPLEQDNISRNRFNEFLRQQYPAQQVFDLGKLESTAPSGKAISFQYESNTYQTLFPGYTSDWGHLNALGQKIISGKFIEYFSQIASPEGSKDSTS